MKTTPDNEAANKIVRARSAMVTTQRFFGALALRLKPVPGNAETQATDGVHLFYNPAWVEEQSMPVVTGVCAKMVAHLVCLHHTRRRGRDAALWKRACDFAANQVVLADGFTLPDGALVNPDYHGLSAEDIYEREKEQQQQDKQQPQKSPDGGDGGAESVPSDDDSASDEDATSAAENAAEPDPGNAGQVLDAVEEDGSKPSPADMTRLETQQYVAAQQAARFATRAGQGSAEQQRILRDLEEAQYDWREELRRFVLKRATDDYSWRRPNRRLMSQGYYLPSLHSSKMGPMVVFIDVSFSTTPWLAEFIEHLKTIWEDVRPERLYVVYVAARVTGVDEMGPDDEFNVNVRGNGGTSFIPAFDWVEAQGIEPACTLYLTDLDGEAPKHQPDYPVIWACPTRKPEPWGERVQLKR